jgi:hypothetical protein
MKAIAALAWALLDGIEMRRAVRLQSTVKSESARERSRLDARLDAALNETFPASDPIAVGRPTGTERLRQRRQGVAAREPQANPRPRAGSGHGGKVRGP